MVTKPSSSYYSDEPSSSSVGDALPAFSEEVQEGHVVVDLNNTQGALNPETEPPPPFTPYEAEYFTDKTGNIVSHDLHLNEDGEALTRFLLTQARQHPLPSVRLRGRHPEQRTRLVTKHENGKVRNVTEHYTEHVVDFNFTLGLGNYLTAFQPVHYSLGDSEPAYRGKMYREIDSNIDGYISTRQAPKDQVKFAKHWVWYRTRTGLAPWIGPKDGWQGGPNSRDRVAEEEESRIPDDAEILKSSRTLRQWADEYCTSNKILKEFVYERVPYGWSIHELENAIQTLVAGTYYRGQTDITWDVQGAHIFIRPDSRLSRTLSNNWLKFLLWITLIYPFIWLFKRFHPRGGGHWQVCGAAYPYKRLVKRQLDQDGALKPLPAGSAVESPIGAQLEVVGVREGQWFKQWESTIRENVLGRVQVEDIITVTNSQRPHLAGGTLDGYYDW